MEALIESVGLDSYIGFFHQVDYGRTSLSLDLVEPFRHILVDRLVLKLVNMGSVASDDFYLEEKKGGYYLKRDSIKVFLRHYEEFCNRENLDYSDGCNYSFRRIFRKEVEGIRSALAHEKPFEPYLYK